MTNAPADSITHVLEVEIPEPLTAGKPVDVTAFLKELDTQFRTRLENVMLHFVTFNGDFSPAFAPIASNQKVTVKLTPAKAGPTSISVRALQGVDEIAYINADFTVKD